MTITKQEYADANEVEVSVAVLRDFIDGHDSRGTEDFLSTLDQLQGDTKIAGERRVLIVVCTP